MQSEVRGRFHMIGGRPFHPPRPRKRRPTLLCWLRGTAPDGTRLELRRAPTRPGQAPELRGGLGPDQAIALAGQLERRGWSDVRIVRKRFDQPASWISPTPNDVDADEPPTQRVVRLGRERLLGVELALPPGPAAAQRGLKLASRGEWAAARDALRQATETYEAPAELWRALGVATGRCGDWRHARRALERAIKLGDGEAPQLLDEVHQIEVLLRTTLRRAWDADAQRQLGLLLMAWERGDDALARLERAVALAPTDFAARMALGLEMLCRGRWDDATGAYRAALDLAADDDQLAAADEGLSLARAGHLPDDPSTGERDVWQELITAG